jgi:hypothetical protein
MALLEANNKITDLINKYPTLAKYVEESSNVEGLKIISEEGQEEILKEQAKTVSAANARKFAA